MKNKIALLAMALSVGALAGCGSSTEPVSTVVTQSSTTDTATAENKEDERTEDNNAEVNASVEDNAQAEAEDVNALKPSINEEGGEWDMSEVVAEEGSVSAALSDRFTDMGTLGMEAVMELANRGTIDMEGNGDDTDVYEVGVTYSDSASSVMEYGIFISDKGRIIVKTPDERFVRFDQVPMVDWIWGNLPVYAGNDLDGDGENELVLKTSVLHGTGFMRETVFVVDKDETGKWRAYHITPEWLTGAVSERVKFVPDGDNIICKVDGVEAYAEPAEGAAEMTLYLDSELYYDINGKDITANVGPLLISAENPMGVYPKALQAKIKYLGSGKWELADISAN